MDTNIQQSKITKGNWKINYQDNDILIENEAGKRTIAEIKDGKGETMDEANAKIIVQSKNNLSLLQEIESIYSNKKLRSGLSGFEVGILSSVQEAITKSIS